MPFRLANNEFLLPQIDSTGLPQVKKPRLCNPIIDKRRRKSHRPRSVSRSRRHCRFRRCVQRAEHAPVIPRITVRHPERYSGVSSAAQQQQQQPQHSQSKKKNPRTESRAAGGTKYIIVLVSCSLSSPPSHSRVRSTSGINQPTWSTLLVDSHTCTYRQPWQMHLVVYVHSMYYM